MVSMLKKDLITLGLIGGNVRLEEIIPGYDKENIRVLSEKNIPDPKHFSELLNSLANESYNRVKKKFKPA